MKKNNVKFSSMSNEPAQLRRGKAFHKLIQEEWVLEARGVICPERTILKPNGRRGRIDILTDPDEADVAVVEIKASDWDKMTSKAVRRNIRRQLNQIWNYVDSQLALDKTVSTGIIFPKNRDRGNDLRSSRRCSMMTVFLLSGMMKVRNNLKGGSLRDEVRFEIASDSSSY